MVDWTTIIVMSGTDDLWFNEMEEGIDRHMIARGRSDELSRHSRMWSTETRKGGNMDPRWSEEKGR